MSKRVSNKKGRQAKRLSMKHISGTGKSLTLKARKKQQSKAGRYT